MPQHKRDAQVASVKVRDVMPTTKSVQFSLPAPRIHPEKRKALLNKVLDLKIQKIEKEKEEELRRMKEKEADEELRMESLRKKQEFEKKVSELERKVEKMKNKKHKLFVMLKHVLQTQQAPKKSTSMSTVPRRSTDFEFFTAQPPLSASFSAPVSSRSSSALSDSFDPHPPHFLPPPLSVPPSYDLDPLPPGQYPVPPPPSMYSGDPVRQRGYPSPSSQPPFRPSSPIDFPLNQTLSGSGSGPLSPLHLNDPGKYLPPSSKHSSMGSPHYDHYSGTVSPPYPPPSYSISEKDKRSSGSSPYHSPRGHPMDSPYDMNSPADPRNKPGNRQGYMSQGPMSPQYYPHHSSHHQPPPGPPSSSSNGPPGSYGPPPQGSNAPPPYPPHYPPREMGPYRGSYRGHRMGPRGHRRDRPGWYGGGGGGGYYDRPNMQ